MSKLVLINPIAKYGMNDALFSEKLNWNNALDRYIFLKRELRKKGHRVHTTDKEPLENADLLIFVGINLRDPDYTALKKSKKLQQKAILIMPEPRCVNRYQYMLKHRKYFRRIYTWDDSLVDGKKILKWNYPLGLRRKKWYAFKKKRFLCMMSGNKISFHRQELYSKRYEFAKFCEHTRVSFDLYGTQWNESHSWLKTFAIFAWYAHFFERLRIPLRYIWYFLTGRPKLRVYRGTVDDKYKVLSMYKFTVCFENQIDVGYITEKILDCFIAGTVPIYYGASNIEQHIPPACFIDYRTFASDDALVQFLEKMTEKKYESYRTAMKKFLKSHDLFSLVHFRDQILKELSY